LHHDLKSNYDSFQFIVILFALLLISCGQQKESDKVNLPTQLKYATGFSVRTEGNAKYVTINLPYPGAQEAYNYLLVPQGEEAPAHDNQTQVIYTPIKKNCLYFYHAHSLA
jgi:hypothetical protein